MSDPISVSPRILRMRGDLLYSIRSFFRERDYVEVETPVRVAVPALEDHIEAEPAGDMYLRTSPELHMKRLLAEGHERIFQIGPCFRQGERGRLHQPEYTMLEWYRTEADYMDILEETQDLFLQVNREVLHSDELTCRSHTVSFAEPWAHLRVQDVFQQEAGWDPAADFDPVRFDEDLVTKVEPSLDPAVPTVLYDYPARAAALARLHPEDPAVAQRWELYIGGLELANAYTELNDPEEQRQRFEQCAELRRREGRPVYPLDEAFLKALTRMPPAGGIALGLDRWLMLLADVPSLDDILPFRDG